MPKRRRSAAGITTEPRLPTRLGSSCPVRPAPVPAVLDGDAFGSIDRGFLARGMAQVPNGRVAIKPDCLNIGQALLFWSGLGWWVNKVTLARSQEDGQTRCRLLLRGDWVGRIEWRAVPGASEPKWAFGVRIGG